MATKKTDKSKKAMTEEEKREALRERVRQATRLAIVMNREALEDLKRY